MRKLIRVTGLCLLSATSGLPAFAGDYRQVPSLIPGAPHHILPMSASEIADARMREILAAKLSETLDFQTMTDGDLDDLMRLADMGDDFYPEEQASLAIKEESFPVAGKAPTSQAEPAAEGLRLSDEQMQTMALLLASMSNPEFISMVQSGFSPRDPWMNARGPVMEPSQGASNANILLRGWSVALRQDGSTRLFQDGNPGSEITLEPGLVIGALGAVVDIRQIGQEVLVTFENGDSISGRSDFALDGIPPIPPLSQLGSADQDVILSSPARTRGNISTSNN